MKTLELKRVQTDAKIGQECPAIEPNLFDDCLMVEDGKPVGFFMRQVPAKLARYIEIANKELRSKRVPKSSMKRSSGLHDDGSEVLQYSTIIGAVPPKPHMRRAYKTMSSVHQVPTAKNFIKAMLLACRESEELIRQVMPGQFDHQLSLLEQVPPKWRFGRLYTSSISNFNISANYHQDRANIKETVNVIITKRENSEGGNLNVPEYGATFDQCDGSILVYPAWRDMHGVTPIVETGPRGYRNSLVFYPLAAFVGDE